MRFPAEPLALIFYFHILAGAQLGEVMPTQARDSCSFGEKAWLHVLLSHPRAGTSSPPGMPDLQGLAPVPALLSSVCHGSAGSVVVQCPAQGFCGSGVPTLLLSLLGWCRRGWIEGLGVLLVPAGGQFGAACALSSTVYPESQPFCWTFQHRALGSPEVLQVLGCYRPFPLVSLGSVLFNGFLSHGRDYYPCPFPVWT